MDPCSLHSAKRKAHEGWKYVREERIVLNVGGQCFETSRQTLCKDEHSMLAALLRHHSGDTVIWIDRDGQRFSHVLNYLRNGTIWLTESSLLRAVKEEAEFFCLSGLQELCEENIQEIEAKEAEIWKIRCGELQALWKMLKSRDGGGISTPTAALGTLISKGNFADALVLDWNERVFQTDADF